MFIRVHVNNYEVIQAYLKVDYYNDNSYFQIHDNNDTRIPLYKVRSTSIRILLLGTMRVHRNNIIPAKGRNYVQVRGE